MSSSTPKKIILLLAGLCLVLVVGTAYEIMRLSRVTLEETPAFSVIEEENVDGDGYEEEDLVNFVSSDTIVRREIYYKNCGHLENQLLRNDPAFVNKSFSEIAAEGWNIFWAEGGQAVAFKEVERLCPEDEDKLHIGEHEGKIAIFSGPAGSNGELVEELGIAVENLYPEWQNKLAQGGIDFENQEDLLAALDNLDEFKIQR